MVYVSTHLHKKYKTSSGFYSILTVKFVVLFDNIPKLCSLTSTTETLFFPPLLDIGTWNLCSELRFFPRPARLRCAVHTPAVQWTSEALLTNRLDHREEKIFCRFIPTTNYRQQLTNNYKVLAISDVCTVKTMERDPGVVHKYKSRNDHALVVSIL